MRYATSSASHRQKASSTPKSSSNGKSGNTMLERIDRERPSNANQISSTPNIAGTLHNNTAARTAISIVTIAALPQRTPLRPMKCHQASIRMQVTNPVFIVALRPQQSHT